MLTLIEITGSDITGWLFARDKADLLEQLHQADPDNDHIQAVIKEVHSMPEAVPGGGKLALRQTGTFLLYHEEAD